MSSHILVTGGAGFIGSHICDNLVSKNHKVRILDNLSTGSIKNIEHLLENPNVEFLLGDVSDIETMRKACVGIDMICHQAALGSVPRSVADPLSSHISNVNGFLNMLIVAKENNIKRIVYASSSSVYGDSTNLPKEESIIGEQLSPYAVTKYIDELYAKVFTRLYGLQCIGLRYFNIFGPRQNPNGQYAAVIPKFVLSLKNNERPTINGDGSFSRDFTFVENAVLANCLALFTENKECYGEIFNVGAEGRVTLTEMFAQIKDLIGSDLEPIFGDKRVGDIPHSNANVDKAKKMLKYLPLVKFNDGLKLTVEYFMKK